MSETLLKTEYRDTVERLPDATPPPEAQEQAARERTIARLRLLWKRRRFLLRAAGIGLLSSLLLAFLIPARYTSTTRLMPPDHQNNQSLAVLAAVAGQAPASLASMAGDLLGVKSTGDLFVGVLQSRTVQDALIQKFELRKVYWDGNGEDTRKELAEHTGLSSDRKSGIITIEVTDRSPQRAAAMAQEYVVQLNRVVVELNTSSAHRERVFLDERLKAVKQDLEGAEKEFSQFASKNTAIDIKEQARAMVAAAATLQGQLIAAQAQLEGLRQIYTDNNTRVKMVEANVAELKRELEKLGGKDVSPGASAADLKADSLYPSIRKLPLLGVEYADLFRRMKVQETIFETLTQEDELAKVQEAKETPTVKVLDVADVPEKRSFPPRVPIVLLGTLLAFCLASAWVLGRTAWEATDPSDVRKAFAQEVFGTFRGELQTFSLSRNGSKAGSNGDQAPEAMDVTESKPRDEEKDRR